MKAIYQKPETDMILVATQSPIAASLYGSVEDGFSLDDLGTTDATEGNLSRGRSIWDDED